MKKSWFWICKDFKVWDEQHWMKPQVSEDIIYELTTVKLMYKTDKPSKSLQQRPSKDLNKDLVNNLEKT